MPQGDRVRKLFFAQQTTPRIHIAHHFISNVFLLLPVLQSGFHIEPFHEYHWLWDLHQVSAQHIGTSCLHVVIRINNENFRNLFLRTISLATIRLPEVLVYLLAHGLEGVPLLALGIAIGTDLLRKTTFLPRNLWRREGDGDMRCRESHFTTMQT